MLRIPLRIDRCIDKSFKWRGIFSFQFFAVRGFICIIALAINPELNSNLSILFVIMEVLLASLKGLVIVEILLYYVLKTISERLKDKIV